MKRFLEGLEKVDGKRYRLRETYYLDSSTIEKTSLSESTLVESYTGETFPVHNKYSVRVWDRSFNLNGRNYGNILETVVHKQPVTLGFTNHPADGKEDVREYFAIEKNPHIREDGWLWIDLYFVGTYGRLAEEILSKGGPIAVSSSALGDLDEKGNVLVEGFELERYADWVDKGANGQQQFYASVTETIKNTDKNNLNKESVTIYTDSTKNTGEKEMTTINEKVLKLNIIQLIEKANTISNPKDRLNELNLISEYLSDCDDQLVSKYKEAIAITTNELDELTKKGEQFGSLQETITSLNSEIENLNNDKEASNKEYATLKEQYESIIALYEESKKKEEKLVICEAIITELKDRVLLAEAVSNTKVEAKDLLEKETLIRRYRSKIKNLENILSSTSSSELQTEVVDSNDSTLKEEIVKRRAYRKILKERKSSVEVISLFNNTKVEEFYSNLVTKDKNTYTPLKESFQKMNSIKEAQAFVMNLDDSTIPSIPSKNKIETRIEETVEPVIEEDNFSSYLSQKGYK